VSLKNGSRVPAVLRTLDAQQGCAPARDSVAAAAAVGPWGRAKYRRQGQVFEAMLAGWRDQQLRRNLGRATIEDRLVLVRRFHRFTDEWPWRWQARDVEEFTADMRGSGGLTGEGRALSTARGYQSHVRLFCEYVADPRYE
jgi:hypothetical protein